MKRIIVLLSVLGWTFCPGKAEAVTLSDIVVFSPPTAITDTQSGNQINYSYQHDFEELNTSGLSLISGTLSLTHLGNANSEPTAEAWTILSGNGILIGKLSGSNSTKTADSWELAQDILNEIKINPLWKLGIGLSEITPFNSEKIDLYESRLTIHYDLPKTPEKIPNAPEPSTLFLMIGGILLQMLRIKSRE